jgi:hypothetical protein
MIMATARDILRSKKTAMIVVPLALLCLIITLWRLSAGANPSQAVAQAYYSDDDGATWFTGPGNRIMPFDHQGKPAVGAAVFVDATGKRVVGYLIRHSAAAREAFKRAKAAGRGIESVSVQPMLEARRPQSPSAAWIPDNDPEFMVVTHPTNPDGSPLRPAHS